MIARDQFYVPDDGPPKQGDILLAGVARLVAVDAYTPRAWLPLDVYTHAVASGGLTGNDIRLRIGPALVLTTSHDCHFDKEWNRRVRQLVKGGVDQQEAERIAEEDPTLDRAFMAAPSLVLMISVWTAVSLWTVRFWVIFPSPHQRMALYRRP